MNDFIEDYLLEKAASNSASLDNMLSNKFELKITALMNSAIDMRLQRKEWYPTLLAVKNTNVRNFPQDAMKSSPRPLGYLYYDKNNNSPAKFLYSNGKSDNMVELCNFNTSITFENKDQSAYMPFITRQGDIICVYRGELETTEARGRQNPIVYPYGDLANPVAVDLSGKACKPTGWLQNCGVDFVYSSTKNYFMFAEYTRSIHTTCNIWKVVPPFTSAANWSIVKTLTTSGSETTGLEHFHTINYDPFSGAVFAGTGDDDANSKIYMSVDDGATWTVVSEGNTESRATNLIFTKDYLYYASDDPNRHVLIKVGRTNNIPDFATKRTKLCDLPINQATYTTCLLHNPNGLLMLDRYDDNHDDAPLQTTFWSFETNSLHTVANILPIVVQAGILYGFRCDAVSFYQPTNDNRIICGFGNSRNTLRVLDNQYNIAGDEYYNLALEVVKLN